MSTVGEAIKLAVQYQRVNRLVQAEQIYRQILAKQPDHPDALHGLSMLAQQAGQYQTAEKLLYTLLKAQPASFKAWFSLGNVHQIQGHLSAAVEAYQKALALQPQAFVIYNNLGYTLQQQGKVNDAIASYQKALQLQPNFPEAEVNLANALHSQGKLSPEQQVKFAQLNHDLGVNRKKAGDFKSATTYYRQALDLQPDLAIAHYNLGVVLQAQGETDEAVCCYQKALEINPSDSSLYKTLSRQKLTQLTPPPQQQNSSRLKVAFIGQPFVLTRYPTPADSIGILTYEMARRLAATSDITVYTGGEKRQESVYEGVRYKYIPIKLDRSALKRLEEIPGFYSSTRPSFASSLYYAAYALQIAHDLRKHPCDVVHIHNLSQFAPIIRALNPKCKIVLHTHCEWLNQLDHKTLERRLGAVDCVLSPSQYISGQVQQRFLQFSERCQVIANGVDADRYLDFLAQPQTVKSSSQKPIKKLLFVGRVCPEKGSHILLEAFRQVLLHDPNVQLTLVGPVGVIPYEYLVGLSDDPKVSALASFHQQDDAWTGYLRQYMAQLSEQVGEGTAPPVTFTGLLPPSQLPNLYQQADIFVFPSICHEAFGMPIAEAMITGLPVVATQGGAFPELVEHGKTGLIVERSDVNALADAIIHLLKDADLRKAMGQAARQRGVEQFTFDKVAVDLQHLYTNLCCQAIPASSLALLSA
ncbi:MAG: glycosyltransferase [Mojavia pulchra JT2-VF2]|jgi:glycosyltransferase involved in cell wall biosynthesis/Tfp pilus assembly protein PilF|uniref:Glycosyltransferase n=1 Tax=Mojavia pulchra JT2-VF2 TaxID=287848 RepID=A0A951Q4B3_9NOST|nr:glycosyltransferase [Mojavia pulchra JT2-VF2]